MGTLFRRTRRVPARSASATVSSSFWTLSRVFFIIVILAWALTIFILFRQRQWKGEEQRGVVIVQSVPDEVRQPLTLVILKPDQKVFLLPIPPEQKIETPFNYGVYTSDALGGLTQLEDLKWEFLLSTLSLEFGVGLDGIIWTDSPVTTLGDLRAVGLQAMLNRKATTLPWWDRMTLWRKLQQMPSYQIETEEIARYLQTETQMLDTNRYDRWAEFSLQDARIRESGFSVSVQNGSGIEGYAGRVGRMLGLMGYDLRSVETVGTNTISELLWAQDPGNGWSQRRLRELLPVFSSRTDSGTTEQARSQAVIRLGTDQVTLFQNPR